MSVLSDFAKLDRCMLCGVKAINTWPPQLQTHHIARGANKAKARNERCALLRTCPRCHAERLDGMDPITQYALKAIYDGEYYDRIALNRLRGRADEAITEDEVAQEVTRLMPVAVLTGYPFERLT